MQNVISRHMNRARRGFSLVELVIVIIIIAILAVAIFAGGSVVVKKSQVSRTISDLHNFSVAVESTLNENPDVANITTNETATDAGGVVGTKDKYDALLVALNKNLPADYQLGTVTNTSANITKYVDNTSDGIQVWQSAKTDSWGNPYFVIFDCNERNTSNTHAEFFVTVVSAGPDAKTSFVADAKIGNQDAAKADDIFLLAQYSDGDVAAMTYDWTETAARAQIATGTTAAEFYHGTVAKCPVIIKHAAV